ncbi:unnamed protein product [Eruca vesicaria subsp. sativa]|uniref:Exostosin GT47 domain-containing protein n=1 Tax=Eruca vesicaria subsp. sativa TaxID=29727 RepID=A0ABC8M4I3_ERUVS|nr:unnamed protein product [Eruca vesicaria subsp. sativa]
MTVSVSKRRPRTFEKTETEKQDSSLKDHRTSCSVFSSSVLYLVPLMILFPFLIYLFSTSTTVICISSRKLNDLYCLTAASHQPGLHVPVSNFTKLVSENVLKSDDVLGEGGEKSFVENESFARERDSETSTGERVSDLDQDLKLINDKNLESFLDQDFFRPKDEVEETALKAVNKYLKIQRSWLSMGHNRNKQGSCEGQGIYVYDLPSKFNKDLLGECSDMVPWVNFCSFFKNDGLGESIEKLGKGWFNTHQYSLEPIFHSRVLKHPCRVYDENQAKLFYVPYYGGMDVLRWHFKNVSNDVKDVLAIEVLKWLASKKSWRKNYGKDHVFVLGKITWDFRRENKSSWGSSLLAMQEMENPTKLLIERNAGDVNDIAIPHPTFFHPRTDDDISSWQNKIITQPRRSLISFAGGARPGNPESIRSTLIDQCLSSPDQCRFLNCANGGCNEPESVIDLFQDSEFCLQPPGDSATRKSVFDSLVSGCIPVLFDPFTAYYQYSWHLPEDHRLYSVYINQDDLKAKKLNVIKKLMSVTLREREDMRNYIVQEILPGLVYGDSTSKFERFRDAFDITMDSLFHKISKNL